MNLNQDQKRAFDEILKGRNVFVTGGGGVGKSYLIRHIRDLFEGDTILVTPTGISALNIGGSTIHRTFRLPIHILTKEDQRVSDSVLELFGKDGPVKRIIFDEISMCRSDVFITIDWILRKARKHSKSFGGIQVIAFGDFFQLCPVVSKNEHTTFYDEYSSSYCFNTNSWLEANFKVIEMTEMMRQSDEVMIKNLNQIRKKEDSYKNSVLFFNDIGIKNQVTVLDQDPVFLCSTNATANTINQQNYSELDGEEYSFEAKYKGVFNEEPAPKILNVKHGTKLLCCANNEQMVNGEVCYFLGMVGSSMRVVMEKTEQEMLVDTFTWSQYEYEVKNGKLTPKVVSQYTQYPFKYGWAVTIHKSQGMTLDHAMIDVGSGLFSHGQAYVALSRLKTLDGLGLLKEMKFSDIIVDKEVIEFYDNNCSTIATF